MTTIAEKTKELANLIIDTPEYLNWRKAEDDMYADEAAAEFLGRLEQKRQFLAKMQEQQVQINKEDINEFHALQQKVESLEIVQAYRIAQESFNEILNNINRIIGAAITGVEDCGGQCSSCSSSCSH